MANSVLIVDDEKNILVTLSRALKVEGWETAVAGSAAIALEKIEEKPFDVILTDVRMPGMDGIELLSKLRETGRLIPVVMMSGHATIETAVEAVRLGAFDFIEKPIGTERLVVTLENSLRFARLEGERAELVEEFVPTNGLLGDGPEMIRLGQLIERAAPSEGRVLIAGENGTGKEMVARSIHEGSPRNRAPFIKLNCAAVPRDLIESELFGHEKGAFTGAVAARKGKFELADGGTLFLDEVGDMPPDMQAKLLRVLQEGEIERVGGAETFRVDVRVISATNKNLEAMVDDGAFREDLYYRLNVVPIHVPPLRFRREDIPMLVDRFVDEACRKNNRQGLELSSTAMELLVEHDWPGNVRELRNVVERLVILCEGPTVSLSEIRELLPKRGKDGPKDVGSSYRPGKSFKELVSQAEKAVLEGALEHHRGNMTETAAALGLERSHLYKKCRALGIRR